MVISTTEFNGFVKYSMRSIRFPPSINAGLVLHHLIGTLTIYSIACRTLGFVPLHDYGMCQRHKSACPHTVQVMIHISVGKVNQQEWAELGWWPPAKGQRVNSIHFWRRKIFSYWLSKARGMFLLLQNTYHRSIFIWHNGPICFLLTYAAVSACASNHWKLTGCCVCSFH